jgi:hypothetical protein
VIGISGLAEELGELYFSVSGDPSRGRVVDELRRGSETTELAKSVVGQVCKVRESDGHGVL